MCLHVALLVATFLEILTKPVITNESSHCYPCWMCSALNGFWVRPFQSVPTGEDDRRPSTLQLATEGLTASKLRGIDELAYKNKALAIVLQETHCTTADKLVITNFSLAGSVLSRNVCSRAVGMATGRSISRASSDKQRGCGYMLTSTNLNSRDSHLWPSRRPHTPLCMLATSTASMSTGVTAKSPDGKGLAS